MSTYEIFNYRGLKSIIVHEGDYLGICDKTLRSMDNITDKILRNGTYYNNIITIDDSNYKTFLNEDINIHPFVFKKWRDHDPFYVKMGYINATPVNNTKEPTINISLKDPFIAELFGKTETSKVFKVKLSDIPNMFIDDLSILTPEQLKAYICGYMTKSYHPRGIRVYGNQHCGSITLADFYSDNEQLIENIKKLEIFLYYGNEFAGEYDKKNVFHTTNVDRIRKFIEEIGVISKNCAKKLLEMYLTKASVEYFNNRYGFNCTVRQIKKINTNNSDDESSD